MHNIRTDSWVSIDDDEQFMSPETPLSPTQFESSSPVPVDIKQPTVTIVQDKPVVEKILENKYVEIHHKNVIRQVREQPIIEIEKIKKTKHVKDADEIVTIVEPTEYQTSVNGGPQVLRVQSDTNQPATRVVERIATAKHFYLIKT
jgi:hypothetical protein